MVPGIVEIGMSSVVSLGVTGLVALLVTVNGIPGDVAYITGAVDYTLPDRFSVGSAIYVSNKIRLEW